MTGTSTPAKTTPIKKARKRFQLQKIIIRILIFSLSSFIIQKTGMHILCQLLTKNAYTAASEKLHIKKNDAALPDCSQKKQYSQTLDILFGNIGVHCKREKTFETHHHTPVPSDTDELAFYTAELTACDTYTVAGLQIFVQYQKRLF